MTHAIDQEPQRLVLRNEMADLPRLSRWIEACTRDTVSPDVAYAVALCLEEAVVNIIMHSGAPSAQVEIAVELAREGAVVIARVDDDGRAFDPTRVPPPAPTGSLGEARVGELGIPVGSSRVDLQACKLEYSIVSPK